MFKIVGHRNENAAPLGVFTLIAITAAKYGFSVLAPFAKVILAIFTLGCILQMLIVYSGLMRGHST